MRVVIRSAAIGFVATIAAVLLAFTTTMASARADTALIIGGIGQPTLPDFVMSTMLNGEFANYDRVNVHWPAQARPYTGSDDLTMGQSIAAGTATLDAALTAAVATGQSVTVVGLSGGALVVDEELHLLADRPTLPNVKFVVIADSSRQSFITGSQYTPVLDYTYQPPPDTPYHIVVVTDEYDGFADFPDRPWNLLADANAVAGIFLLHITTAFADLSKVPEQDITVVVNSKGGTTTHYLVPTATLPLVQLFPSLAPMEATLRQQIDAAYSRNDARAVTSSASSLVSDATNTATNTANDATTNTVTTTTEPTFAPSADVSVGAATHLAGAPAKADQQLANTTHRTADATAATAVPANEQHANTTSAVGNTTAGAAAQEKQELVPTSEAVSNPVADVSDGNKLSSSTTTGTTRPTNVGKGDGIRAATGTIQRLFSGKPTTTTTEKPSSHTSTTTRSQTSSSASSSAGNSSAP